MDILDYLDEDQSLRVNDFVNAMHKCTKGKLMKLAFNGDTSNIDSAVPDEWVIKMRLTNTNFDTFWWCWSYRREDGEFNRPIHLGERIISNMMMR